MIEIERPNIVAVEQSEDFSYGKFEIEPLERGFGTTLGNALRRILLSSLPGVAVTSIKIEGIHTDLPDHWIFKLYDTACGFLPQSQKIIFTIISYYQIAGPFFISRILINIEIQPGKT